MRKSACALAVAVIGVLVAAVPAGATPNQSLNRGVSGPFSGTGVFSVTPACMAQTGLFDQVFDATYTSPQGGTGTFHTDGCIGVAVFAPPVITFSYSGSFVLTTPNGAVLRGAVTGLIAGNPVLDLTLTPTSGTKGFNTTTGTIQLTGTWVSTMQLDQPGPISGTLAGDLQRAGSAA